MFDIEKIDLLLKTLIVVLIICIVVIFIKRIDSL